MAKIINILLSLVLCALFLLALTMGSTNVPALEGLLDWFVGNDTLPALVIGEIRLPRTVLALLVGAALGLSGAALQGLLRNPLADPSLTGASQGAALGAAVVFYFGILPVAGIYAPVIAGLLGAFFTLALVMLLAGKGSIKLVLLAGLAINTICGALLAAVLNFAPNPYAMQELVFWLLGSVADKDFRYTLIMAVALVLGFVLIFSQRRFLLALSLGEKIAKSQGINVQFGSRVVVLGSAILVGSTVAVAGGIGFVGLIVPHLIRPWVRARADAILVPSMLAGACLVCAADIAVRLLPIGRELKIGVLTALIGAPFFIALVLKERKQWL